MYQETQNIIYVKSWCDFKVFRLQVIAMSIKCRAHTQIQFYLIYLSVMREQNQTMVTFIRRKYCFHHISTMVFICPTRR